MAGTSAVAPPRVGFHGSTANGPSSSNPTQIRYGRLLATQAVCSWKHTSAGSRYLYLAGLNLFTNSKAYGSFLSGYT
uniref:Uncharacterized protein n=1 Tax=Oryza punctata TaxID=4537 RepID=A0A0E0KMI0_ORYPU